MKKKLVITLLIMIIIIQSIIPIRVYANEDIGSETDIETETQKKSFFDPDITYDDDDGEVNDVEYRMFIPSTANEYEKIPLILWLHGWIDNPTLDKIETKGDGFPKAVMQGSSLEKFSAYILCPKFPGDNVNQWWNPQQIKQILDKVFEEYNVDRDNVVIIGHSFGGGNAPKIVNALPGYFSKAVICSGYAGSSILSIPTQWYVGNKDSESATKCGESIENQIASKNTNYEKNILCRIISSHGTPPVAYNLDNGEFGRYCK